MRHRNRNLYRGRHWVTLFGLAVLLPAVSLGLLALRAYRGERIREQYQRRERQQQIIRLLENDLSNWILSHRESADIAGSSFAFEVRQNRIFFPHLRVYLSPDHRREAEIRLPGPELRLWQEAQSMELRGARPAAAMEAYRKLLSRSSPLSSWARLALPRLSLQRGGLSDAAAWLERIQEQDQEFMTESGIPVRVAAALLLIEHKGIFPPQKTADFLARTLSDLADGQWQLNAAQWSYHARDIGAALDSAPDL